MLTFTMKCMDIPVSFVINFNIVIKISQVNNYNVTVKYMVHALITVNK